MKALFTKSCYLFIYLGFTASSLIWANSANGLAAAASNFSQRSLADSYRVKQRTTFTMSNGEWLKQAQYQYDYRDNGFSVVVMQWSSDNNEWVASDSNVTIMNQAHEVVVIAGYEWDTTWDAWNNKAKINYEYNGQGHMTGAVQMNWDKTAGKWVNHIRSTITPGEQGKPEVEIAENFQASSESWIKTTRNTFYYENGKQAKIVSANWNADGETWVDSTGILFQRDSLGRLSAKVYQKYNAGTETWTYTYRQSFHYDSAGNMIEKVYSQYVSSVNSWMHYAGWHYSREYDEHGNTSILYDSTINLDDQLYYASKKHVFTYESYSAPVVHDALQGKGRIARRRPEIGITPGRARSAFRGHALFDIRGRRIFIAADGSGARNAHGVLLDRRPLVKSTKR